MHMEEERVSTDTCPVDEEGECSRLTVDVSW